MVAEADGPVPVCPQDSEELPTGGHSDGCGGILDLRFVLGDREIKSHRRQEPEKAVLVVKQVSRDAALRQSMLQR